MIPYSSLFRQSRAQRLALNVQNRLGFCPYYDQQTDRFYLAHQAFSWHKLQRLLSQP